MAEAQRLPTRVDTHAHVFRRDLPLAPNARHAPQRDALLDEYLGLLERHGVTHAVLTAPSFLGTDNAFLLQALAREPRRLRGTVIVDPDGDPGELRRMQRLGVTGVRLNFFGMQSLPDVGSASYRRLFATVRELDWHVEIYLEGPRLARLLPIITGSGAKVVVDHFGSPDPDRGTRCEGFAAVLAAVAAGRTWVKLSAPYRLGGADPSVYAQRLLAECGPQRLLWGSDWPWTQNDAGMSYGLALGWLDRWVPDPVQRRTILGATACELFGFTDG